jgi:catechol 2,3-dioxygenase-like lactoylglutathione lyase family enzyme
MDIALESHHSPLLHLIRLMQRQAGQRRNEKSHRILQRQGQTLSTNMESLTEDWIAPCLISTIDCHAENYPRSASRPGRALTPKPLYAVVDTAFKVSRIDFIESLGRVSGGPGIHIYRLAGEAHEIDLDSVFLYRHPPYTHHIRSKSSTQSFKMRTFAVLSLLASLALALPTQSTTQAPLGAQNTAVFGIGIPVTNAKRSIEFYTKTLDLGLQQVGMTLDFLIYKETILSFAPGATASKTPGSSLVIMEYPTKKTLKGDEIGKVIFYVDDVAAQIAKMKQKKVEIMLDMGELAMVKDPDGFVIEFMKAK